MQQRILERDPRLLGRSRELVTVQGSHLTKTES
jgi:hypothetical protein